MRAALLYGVGDLRLVDVPRPVAKGKQLVIRNHACGICATDIRKYRTLDGGSLKLPMNLGHEFVGTVVDVGPQVEGFELGMRIVGEDFAGYAEYAVIDLAILPSTHVPSPAVVDPEIGDVLATFAEPLADCLHAVLDQALVRAGETVLIIGAGTMGQLMIGAAKSSGCRVVVSEPVPFRRVMAREMGADVVIDPAAKELVQSLLDVNAGNLVDATFLMTGVPELVEVALETVRPHGRAVLFAGFSRPAKIVIDPNIIHYQEVSLLGSEWVGVGAYANTSHFRRALELIRSRAIDVARLVTAVYPLERIHAAIEKAQDPMTLKVVITM